MRGRLRAGSVRQATRSEELDTELFGRREQDAASSCCIGMRRDGSRPSWSRRWNRPAIRAATSNATTTAGPSRKSGKERQRSDRRRCEQRRGDTGRDARRAREPKRRARWLLRRQPRAAEVEHEALGILHPRSANLERALAFDANAFTLRSRGHRHAGDHRSRRGRAAGLLRLCERRAHRERRRRE